MRLGKFFVWFLVIVAMPVWAKAPTSADRVSITLVGQMYKHDTPEDMEEEAKYLNQANDGKIIYLTEGLRSDSSWATSGLAKRFKITPSIKSRIYGLEFRDAELLMLPWLLRKELLALPKSPVEKQPEDRLRTINVFINWLDRKDMPAAREIWQSLVREQKNLFGRDETRAYFEKVFAHKMSDAEFRILREEIQKYFTTLQLCLGWWEEIESGKPTTAHKDGIVFMTLSSPKKTHFFMAVVYEMVLKTVEYATQNADYVRRAHPPREVSILATDFFKERLGEGFYSEVGVNWRDGHFFEQIITHARATVASKNKLPIVVKFGGGHLAGEEKKLRDKLDPSQFDVQVIKLLK